MKQEPKWRFRAMQPGEMNVDPIKGEPYYEKALEINRKVLGEGHPDTAGSLNNLSVLNFSEEKYKEAANLMRQAVLIRKKALGWSHPDTIPAMENFAPIEQRLRKL